MQEVQTNKAEKMVPIDTSGESIDIEVKEDKVDSVKETSTDTPVVEVQETTDTPVVENKEELEEYSVGVKKRIDKLTKKMREAERREQAAIEYAKKIQVENKNLKSFTNITSKERIASDEERLTSNESLLKASLQQAVENSDVEKQVLAQQELAKLAIEQERLKIRKQKQAQAEAVKEEPENEQPWENTQNQQAQQAQPDPKAQEWAEKNKWFGNDKPMTYTAMSFHDEIVSEGFDVTSDEYYNEIDKRIRKEFPHKFSDGGEASRPKQKVASAVRTSSTGRRTVRLTPSQVAIAKKLGVPLEEYAKHVKEA